MHTSFSCHIVALYYNTKLITHRSPQVRRYQVSTHRCLIDILTKCDHHLYSFPSLIMPLDNPLFSPFSHVHEYITTMYCFKQYIVLVYRTNDIIQPTPNYGHINGCTTHKHTYSPNSQHCHLFCLFKCNSPSFVRFTCVPLAH